MHPPVSDIGHVTTTIQAGENKTYQCRYVRETLGLRGVFPNTGERERPAKETLVQPKGCRGWVVVWEWQRIMKGNHEAVLEMQVELDKCCAPACARTRDNSSLAGKMSPAPFGIEASDSTS